MLNEDVLFNKETIMLEHAQKVIQSDNLECELLYSEYELLSLHYEKLLKLSKKLVSMADKTHKKLQESNDLVYEKVLQLTAAEEQLKELSNTDTLTSLLNRRGMFQWLKKEEKRFNISGVPFSIFLIDIDLFKDINDTYGHNVGDYVLKIISEIMKNSIRAQDAVARWGGEEFLLVLPETDLDGGLIIAEKIRNKIESEVFEIDKSTFSITISLGGSHYREKMSLKNCLDMADKALYKSKTSGRNKVSIYGH